MVKKKMTNKTEKNQFFKAQFNSITQDDKDPTLLKSTMIVHDFERSWNNQVITEEICRENMNTLIGKRIVCKYVPSEDNDGKDALKGHEEFIGINRDGKQDIMTGTIAIGFIENVFIDDYKNIDGTVKKVLYANAVIWNDEKYADIVGLLKEWIDRGIKIHMSVEYIYYNYSMVEGVEYLQSPIVYLANALLNSEERENCAEVLPAFDCASLISLNEKQQWNKAINQLSSKNSNKTEDDNISNSDLNKKSEKEELRSMNKENEGITNEEKKNVFVEAIKTLNEVSFSGIRRAIYDELSKVMIAAEYECVYLADYLLFETYFIYEVCENKEWVNYKVTYVKNEDETITVNYDAREKVVRSSEWIATSNAKIEELTSQLNEKEEELKELNSKVENTTTEKGETMDKYNELAEKVTALNAKVQVLQPLADKYTEEQFEKTLNSAKEFYKEKFENVEAIAVFAEESTQELIKKTVNSCEEESQKAKFELSNLIVNNIKAIEKVENDEAKISLNSIQKATENKELIDEVDSFEKTFGFSK